MTDIGVIKIDLDAVLKERVPGIYKYIPRFAVEWLKRTICQDRLNQLLDENAGLEGADFARGVLRSLNISVKAQFEENLPPAENRHVLYVSNHPLGGLDGMALIDYVQRRHGGQVYFVVNDLLSAVKPLGSVFLPVNKFGKQHREAVAAVDAAFEGNDPIIMFPAGMVSRLRSVPYKGRRCKKVFDLDWNKMFVNKAYQTKRDIVPLFFSGENSRHFYRMANLRTRLGLKFNFEMIYLPQEMVKMENSNLTISCGHPIAWSELTPGKEAADCARAVGAYVYTINSANKPDNRQG
jgi:putative hemolysin